VETGADEGARHFALADSVLHTRWGGALATTKGEGLSIAALLHPVNINGSEAMHQFVPQVGRRCADAAQKDILHT
jgi:hypothetical protein